MLFLKKKINIESTKFGQVCNDVCKLRYKVYTETKYIDPKKYPNRSFTDNYDTYSVSIKVSHKQKLIGSLRLTHFSKHPFPTEKLFNLVSNQYEPQKTIEVGRLIIDKKYRGKSRLISFALCFAMYKYSIDHKIDNWLFHTTEKLASCYESFGAKITLLKSGNLLKENLEERTTADISGYYKNYSVFPYMVKINDIKPRFLI